tara:strand:+ start:132 stop:443 length:312 start_codon:yes stop_codon:yes gene_type:complete
MSDSNTDWTLSFLSSVAGQITSSSGDDPTKLYAWGADDVSEYWLFFRAASDPARCHVTIRSFLAPNPGIYSVIGYCEYHGIECEVDETLPESMCGEPVASTSH